MVGRASRLPKMTGGTPVPPNIGMSHNSPSVRGSMMDQWLRTDASQEAMVSLEMVCNQLTKVTDDLHAWKWVIVSLHNALQGYMVLALHSLEARKSSNKEKWLAAFHGKTGNYPEPYLDSFLSLYKRIQTSEKMNPWGDRPFQPTGTQTESVEDLNYWRNDFIHYFPGNLSLEVTDGPQMVQDCIDIIYFLTFESGCMLWRAGSFEAVRTGDLIQTIRSHLNALREEYEK
jgi:hypothetical protein